MAIRIHESGWLPPRPGRFAPREKKPAPIVEEARWAWRSIWTSRKNLAPFGVLTRTIRPVASRYTDYAIPAAEMPRAIQNKIQKLESKLLKSYLIQPSFPHVITCVWYQAAVKLNKALLFGKSDARRKTKHPWIRVRRIIQTWRHCS